MTRSRLLAGLVALAGLGLAGWFFADRFGPTAEPPPVPAGIDDRGVEAAVRAAREAVASAPRSAAAWGQLGLAFRAHGFEPESDACFAEAARRDPADPRWPYLIGHLKSFREPAAAVPYFRQAAAAAGGPPEARAVARVRLGEVLLEQGDPAAAEAAFRARLADDPADARARYGLGLALMAREDVPGAEAAWKAAAKSAAVRKQALARLAVAARVRGDAGAAADFDRRAAALPDDPKPFDPIQDEVWAATAGRRGTRNKALALAVDGRPADAIELLARAGREDPDPITLGMLGEYQFRAGRYADAEASLRASLALDPGRADSHHYLGLTLAVRADEPGADKPARQREALAELDRALAARPDHPESHLFRGQVLWALGDQPGALAALARGLELAPHKPDMHLALLLFLDKAGRADDARARLPAAEKVVPADDPQFQAVRAKLLAGR